MVSVPIILRHIGALSSIDLILTFTSGSVETVESVEVEDIGCFLCKITISHYKHLVSPGIISMVERRAYFVCSQLNDTHSIKQCRMDVNQFLDQFVENLDKHPVKICAELGMCKANQLDQPSFMAPIISIRRQSIMSSLVDAIKMNSGEATVCKQCKSAIRQTQNKLNRTDDYAENVIGQICKALHPINGSIYVSCHKKLTAQWERTVNFILAQDPQVICSVLGICESPSGFITDKTCESCENIVDISTQSLNNVQKLTQIREYIQNICHLAIDEVKCNQGLVSAVYIYDKVMSMLDKREICLEYKMCKE